MLGAEFSGVDLLALMYMRWSRNMPKPATEWPALRKFADHMRARPSWARLYEVEGLTDWRA
jgi:glutathione S-transferase